MKISSLLIITALLVLISIGGMKPAAVYGQDRTKDLLDLFEQLNRVSAANLIKGLYLTKEQARQLSELARRAGEEKKVVNEKVKQLHDRALKSLKVMELELTSGKAPKPSTLNEVGRVEAQILETFHPYETHMKELAIRARKMLKFNQYDTLCEFKPCIRPPKETANPERIGQVNDTGIQEKMLLHVRALSDDEFKKKCAAYCNNVIALKNRFHIEYGDAEREKKRAERIFIQARALSPLDFELKKKELGERLAGSPRNPRLNDEEALKRIEEYLLLPSMVPLYEIYSGKGAL